MLGLPFDAIWVIDTEFISPDGEAQLPVCMCARELVTGRTVQLFGDEMSETPFDVTDRRTCFVAYSAAAEWGTFAALGWPMPRNVIDLFFEFRLMTAGRARPLGDSLLGALSHFGLPQMTKAQKDDNRALVMRGGPWSAAQRRAILDYCQEDADCLAPLLAAMAPIVARGGRRDVGRALLRGRYSVAVGLMQHFGVPLDGATLARLATGWKDIKRELIADIDVDYGVFDGGTFKRAKFREYLRRNSIPWPKTDTGQDKLDDERVFKPMSEIYPQLQPLRELRNSLGQLRANNLHVGADNRNRAYLNPFGSITGRNQPSNSSFIFGPSVWLRGLIKPAPGWAIAEIDWSQQEIVIAGVLSGDEALLAAATSGDPYIDFAVRAGLAPPGASKATHPGPRAACKVALLGSNYGMGVPMLALRTGLSLIEATDLRRRLDLAYPRFAKWVQESVIDAGLMSGRLTTGLGWSADLSRRSPNGIRNWPMQATGADMMRVGACLLTEAGIRVCAPVHDAFLIEAPVAEIGATAAIATELMARASREVLRGVETRVSRKLFTHPERYSDDRGAVMWDRVMKRLDAANW